MDCPKQTESDEPVNWIVLPVGKVNKLSCQSARRVQFRRNIFGRAKAIKNREMLQVVADPDVEELLRRRQRRHRFWRAVAFERQQRVRLSHQERQFERSPIVTFLHAQNNRETGVDVSVGLQGGRAGKREFRRGEPMTRRRFV